MAERNGVVRGPRDRRRDERRTRIVDAAMRLFARDGYEGTAMAAIAAEAGVSRRTLFRYYPAKSALATAHWDGIIEEFIRLLEERPRDESSAEAMMQALLVWIGKLSIPQLLALSDLPASTPELRAHRLEKYSFIEQAFAEIAHLRRGEDILTAKVLATTVVQIWRLAYEEWLASGRPGHVQDVAVTAFGALKSVGFGVAK